MQRIERYGVIALVVLLVTILAVSLWGERSGLGSFWRSSKPEGSKPERTGTEAKGARRQPGAALDGRTLPLNQPLSSPLDGTIAPAGQVDPSVMPSPLSGGGDVLAADTRRPPLANGGSTDPLAPFPSPTSIDPAGGLRPTETAPPGGRAPGDPLFLSQPPSNGSIASPLSSPSKVTPSGTRTYVVKSGDTLGEIAQRELGSASRWPEIQKLNGSVDPAKLRAGMELALPAGKAVASAGSGKRTNPPASAPAKTKGAAGSYVVKSGDSLTRIAASELGSAKRWTEIRDLNPGVDPTHLVVGAKLVLPKSGPTTNASGAASTTVASAPKGERIGWGPSTAGKKSRVQ